MYAAGTWIASSHTCPGGRCQGLTLLAMTEYFQGGAENRAGLSPTTHRPGWDLPAELGVDAAQYVGEHDQVAACALAGGEDALVVGFGDPGNGIEDDADVIFADHFGDIGRG